MKIMSRFIFSLGVRVKTMRSALSFARRSLAGALSLALAASFAQSGAPGPIRWSEGAPNATSVVKNGTKIEGLKTDNVHVFVSLGDLKETEYNRLWVQVSNHGKSPIDFNPQSAVLVEREKSIRAEVPEKAANAIQKFGEAKSQELSGAHCMFVDAVQCSPTDTQMQMSKQVAAFSSGQAQWVTRECAQKRNAGPR